MGILTCHSPLIYLSLSDSSSSHCTCWLRKSFSKAKQLPNTTGTNVPETRHPKSSAKGSRKFLQCVPVGFTNPAGLLAGKSIYNWHWSKQPQVKMVSLQWNEDGSNIHCTNIALRGKGGAPAESIAMWLLFVSCWGNLLEMGQLKSMYLYLKAPTFLAWLIVKPGWMAKSQSLLLEEVEKNELNRTSHFALTVLVQSSLSYRCSPPCSICPAIGLTQKYHPLCTPMDISSKTGTWASWEAHEPLRQMQRQTLSPGKAFDFIFLERNSMKINLPTENFDSWQEAFFWSGIASIQKYLSSHVSFLHASRGILCEGKPNGPLWRWQSYEHHHCKSF